MTSKARKRDRRRGHAALYARAIVSEWAAAHFWAEGSRDRCGRSFFGTGRPESGRKTPGAGRGRGAVAGELVLRRPVGYTDASQIGTRP